MYTQKKALIQQLKKIGGTQNDPRFRDCDYSTVPPCKIEDYKMKWRRLQKQDDLNDPEK